MVINKTPDELSRKANWVRNQVLEMIVSAGKGHIGGAFSCVDILVALFYGDILRYDPKNAAWDERDRFILSKGHSCTALYAILADQGFFPLTELNKYGKNGSMLGGHPDKSIPGIEANTGSLGNGLGIAAGFALRGKLDKKDYVSVVLVGDGECYEGAIWEAALFASHHKLNNLIVIVDRNGQCVNDFTESCNSLDPLTDKWLSFGWDVVCVDGHSFEDLHKVLSELHLRKSPHPLAIIAETIKGKGVSFMERKLEWHHSVPKDEMLRIARNELGSNG